METWWKRLLNVFVAVCKVAGYASAAVGLVMMIVLIYEDSDFMAGIGSLAMFSIGGFLLYRLSLIVRHTVIYIVEGKK